MFGTNFFSYLITDEAVASTILGIQDTSGWQAGDEICIASTSQTASECEKRTILTVDSSTQVTVTSGLTNAHSGTSPTQAEVGNLTRNIRIRGQSGSLQSYINIAAQSGVKLGKTEFYFLGSSTAGKDGISTNTTTGILNIQYCSIHDGISVLSQGIRLTTNNINNVTISYNIVYNTNGNSFTVSGSTSGQIVLIGNLFIMSLNGISSSDVGITLVSNIIIGSSSNGLTFTESAILGTFSNNTIHSCTVDGILFTNIRGGTLSNTTIWRSGLTNSGGIVLITCSNLTFDGLTMFGNSINNIRIAIGNTMCRFVFNNLISNGDTTFATTSGFQLNDAADITFNDCDFSTVSGIKTAHTNDIRLPTANSLIRLVFNNCKLGGDNDISGLTSLATNSYIGSQKHDQVAGSHKTWKREGILTIDITASMFDVTPSIRMTPNSSTEKLTTLGARRSWLIPVRQGFYVYATVKVRKSVSGDGAAYNGNQPRFMVRRASAMGITSDTIIAVASSVSDGAFETLTGITPIANDNGVFEFYVDCDGDTGWVNVDSFSAY